MLIFKESRAFSSTMLTRKNKINRESYHKKSKLDMLFIILTSDLSEYITLAEDEQQIIQSPGYPNPDEHDSLCFLQWFVTVPDGLYVHIIFNEFSVTIHTYLAIGTGMNPDDETSQYAVYYHRTNPREAVIQSSVAWITYHCGVYGMARGMELTLTTTNITSKAHQKIVVLA